LGKYHHPEPAGRMIWVVDDYVSRPPPN